jgi:hypothetical protein
VKLKAVFVALALAVAAFHAAGAAAGPGKGPKGARGKVDAAATCRVPAPLLVKGTVAKLAADGFALDVAAANAAGRTFIGTQLGVVLGPRAKVTRLGRAALADAAVGDTAVVQARACKRGPAAQSLVAHHVVLVPAVAPVTSTTPADATAPAPTPGAVVTEPEAGVAVE